MTVLVLAALLWAQRIAPAAIEVSAHSRAIQPGEVVVLTMKPAAPAEQVTAHAFGREIPAFRDEGLWRALVGIDLDIRPGKYPVTITSDRGARATYVLIVKPRAFPTRRLKVPESFVTPPASEEDRIVREAALLTATWAASVAERLWTGSFVRPVAEPANSAFGTRSIFNGKPRAPHSGADFQSPAGTPIHAPNGGRVVVARPLYFSGNTVIIDHGLGLFSMLAHLSVMDVHEGDRLAAGDLVGKVGATGRVTGPHLHWAVRAGGARVDPLSLLAVLGNSKLGIRN